MPDFARLQSAWPPRMLSIVRIIVGLLFLEHGLNKLFDFPPTVKHSPYHIFTLVPGVAGILEVFGSLCIILGLFTRPVAFLLSGEMAIAYFMVDSHRAFYPLVNGGDAVILYSFIFLYLSVAGGGAWRVEGMRRRRETQHSVI